MACGRDWRPPFNDRSRGACAAPLVSRARRAIGRTTNSRHFEPDPHRYCLAARPRDAGTTLAADRHRPADRPARPAIPDVWLGQPGLLYRDADVGRIEGRATAFGFDRRSISHACQRRRSDRGGRFSGTRLRSDERRVRAAGYLHRVKLPTRAGRPFSRHRRRGLRRPRRLLRGAWSVHRAFGLQYLDGGRAARGGLANGMVESVAAVAGPVARPVEQGSGLGRCPAI